MCRYPSTQDPNENGLDLLRKQYAKAGDPHLAWKRDSKGGITIVATVGAQDHMFQLVGNDPTLSAAIATLVCRAVNLGKLMMDELEPVP